jgi:hypothetical protein
MNLMLSPTLNKAIESSELTLKQDNGSSIIVGSRKHSTGATTNITLTLRGDGNGDIRYNAEHNSGIVQTVLKRR